mmetsp:Transcript_93107/g.201372  ORF Transcript_93107/g.201372 Transcript_93107/m.201372 type:complete len:80 (-) Transcript_93107:175-414(-)
MARMSDTFRMRCAQLICTVCYKEIVRQNAVVCLERGLLMDRIWNSNITLFTVAEDLYLNRCKQIENNFKNAVEEIQEMF